MNSSPHSSLLLFTLSLATNLYMGLAFEGDYLSFLVGEVSFYLGFPLEGLLSGRFLNPLGSRIEPNVDLYMYVNGKKDVLALL